MNRRAPALAVAVAAPLLLVGALVALRAGDSTQPRKLPVALGAQRATSGAAADLAAPASARLGGVRYEAGTGLPTLDGSAKAYRVAGAVDAAAAGRVAVAFGVDGPPQVADGLSTVASADGQRQVLVSSGGGGWFSYWSNDSRGSRGGSATCVAPPIAPPADSALSSGSTTCVPETTTVPPRAAGFPTEDAARSKALGVLKAAGVATDGARVQAIDDGYAWQVTVTPVVDGLPIDGMQSRVGLDERGVISATGSLGRPVAFDSYPLIGTAAAIKHLNDGSAIWFGPETMVANGGGTAGCPSGARCAAPTFAAPTFTSPGAPCVVTTLTRADGSTVDGCSGESPDTPTVSLVCRAEPAKVPDCPPPTVRPQTARACPNLNAPACPDVPTPTTFVCTDAAPCGVPTCTSVVNPDGSGSGTCSGSSGSAVACPQPLPAPRCANGSGPANVCPEPMPSDARSTSMPAPPPVDPMSSMPPSVPPTSMPPVDPATVPTTAPGDGLPHPPCVPGPTCSGIETLPAPACPPVPPPGGDPVQPQVITLTGATLGLVLAPSGATDAYLLPAYVFTTADGPGPTALAIDTSWLEPPPPIADPACPVESFNAEVVSKACATAPSLPPDASAVACSTPGFSGPCSAGPPDSGATKVPPDPPTTCGPPVAKAGAPVAGGSGGGCPIN